MGEAMSVALLVARLVLAAVFATAGAAKLADLEGSREAMQGFGLSEPLARIAGVFLPVVELMIAVALIFSVSARFAAFAAALLVLCFCAAIGNALAHGKAPDCHCFGQVHSAPAGWRTLARNAVLLAVAGFVAIAGRHNAGASATNWVTRVSAPWLVAIAAGLVIVALVSFQVWFSLQLLAQNGRVLGRLQALEAALRPIPAGGGLDQDGAGDLPLGAGLSGGGLAVGAPAPEFELESTAGERTSLGSLLAGDRPLMLIFTASGCGPCDALLPRIVGWQRQHEQRLLIALIASGDREQITARAREHGLSRVLLQDEHEVSSAYDVHGSPMAVVISSDGLIGSPTVGGGDAVTTLVAQATRPALAAGPHAPSPDGHRNGLVPLRSSPAPQAPRVGEPAPELAFSDLDGRPVSLHALRARPAILLFWNPRCGFCQRLLPDVRKWEASRRSDDTRLVVISAGGSEEENRALGLTSPVIMEDDFRTGRFFGINGTPSALPIGADGCVSGAVAVGGPAVLDLLLAPKGLEVGA
jgi:thiol-disulfide isomerase/thioredoxin/uncharacterized membrane protein YphA (DoxX/SURF4 family)